VVAPSRSVLLDQNWEGIWVWIKSSFPILYSCVLLAGSGLSIIVVNALRDKDFLATPKGGLVDRFSVKKFYEIRISTSEMLILYKNCHL
jgi:hypothetical protein